MLSLNLTRKTKPMKTMTICELLTLFIDRITQPVRAWMLSKRIDMLNTERAISRAAMERERKRQKEIDHSQARLSADLALLKMR
jgi:hypothetical protein